MHTRLAEFMTEQRISCLRLAVRAGVTPRQVSKLRAGECDPKRPTMIGLARSPSAILRRKVRVTELFDLGDGEH